MFPTGWLYGAAGTMALAIGVYCYGHHEGSLAGDAKVATLTQRIAETTAQFERDKAKEKQRQQDISDKAKQDLTNEQLKHQKDVSTLTNVLVSVRQQSSSYVATIERLQGDPGKAACNTALELANKQYGELADAAKQASDRADSAAAIANALNAYSTGTN